MYLYFFCCYVYSVSPCDFFENTNFAMRVTDTLAHVEKTELSLIVALFPNKIIAKKY